MRWMIYLMCVSGVVLTTTGPASGSGQIGRAAAGAFEYVLLSTTRTSTLSRSVDIIQRLTETAMALAPGTRLGHYNVTALIGEGGMGQVWQATDTQLNRDVALKVLPQAFTDDPDRLARFEREAN